MHIIFIFLPFITMIYFVTGKSNYIAGFEDRIASPLQSEAQFNGPNLERANSSVLDESPGFSNQNAVGESGNFLGSIICLF